MTISVLYPLVKIEYLKSIMRVPRVFFGVKPYHTAIAAKRDVLIGVGRGGCAPPDRINHCE
jgi:hypothetical protein